MSSTLQPDSEAAGRRVVVLGGLGFMGSHICRELSARGHAVRIFGKPDSSRELIRDFEREVEVVAGDTSRPDDVLSAIADADVVVHLAHTTVPGSSMNDPEYDFTSNVLASVRWLSRLSETKVRRVLYFSSGGTVYGVPQTNPIGEEHQTNPISSYGITKLAVEKYVAMYASMFGVEYCLIRPSNVYGAGQRLNIGQGVIGEMAHRALCGEPLELWGTGESLRDYLHVDDLTAATLALLGYRGPHRIFNVSSGRGHSVLDIINILRDQLGSLPQIVRKPTRRFDVPVNVLDSSRLRAETGWSPTVGLEEGIARTIAWLKTLQDGKGEG